jgi:DNA-directed RNA polymerase III subunit RPC2
LFADEEEGPVARLAFLLGVEPVSLLSGAELHARSSALVFLNGSILGLHRRPKKFVRAMRCVGF